MPELIEAILIVTGAATVGQVGEVIIITDHSGAEREPTDGEIVDAEVELINLQSAYDANQYKRDRASEYQPIADQLDMIFHDLEDGTKKWQDNIRAIKTKYPKV